MWSKKLIIFFTSINFILYTGIAQRELPYFLNGTWQVENSVKYEHWNILNNHSMKGITYELKDNKMDISEYLEIEKKKKNITYSASVINQNNGKTIKFTMLKKENILTFVNNNHDFPNRIAYELISPDTTQVIISGNHGKEYRYIMARKDKEDTKEDTFVINPNYRKDLATKLEADDYGMKTYFFIILKSGHQPPDDKELMAQSFRGHMDNIQRLVSEEKLIVAGPILKNPNNYRGIFVFNNVSDEAEVKANLETDLAIKNGFLDYDIYSWYGSAALPEYLPFSDKIWKLKP